MNPENEPFSFAEIQNTVSSDIGEPSFFNASDTLRLAYYPVETVSKPSASVILLHSGGACSTAGYQNTAVDLRDRWNISTYLLDLRGHGNSEGPRGDAPSRRQVRTDIRNFIAKVKKNK